MFFFQFQIINKYLFRITGFNLLAFIKFLRTVLFEIIFTCNLVFYQHFAKICDKFLGNRDIVRNILQKQYIKNWQTATD